MAATSGATTASSAAPAAQGIRPKPKPNKQSGPRYETMEGDEGPAKKPPVKTKAAATANQGSDIWGDDLTQQKARAKPLASRNPLDDPDLGSQPKTPASARSTGPILSDDDDKPSALPFGKGKE